jgi:hypothetical protein
MLAAALSLALGTAHAGGIGLVASGGAHVEPLYFYSSVDEDGNPYPSPASYDQFKLDQTIPHYGGGFEFLLGDRDDKIIGVTRFYFLLDGPQMDPSGSTDVAEEDLVVKYRDTARQMGIGTIGLNWGIVGNPKNFQLGLATHIGAAFATNDYTEFMIGNIGPSVTYKPSRTTQVFAEATYQVRYRQYIQHSGNLALGVRYFFD